MGNGTSHLKKAADDCFLAHLHKLYETLLHNALCL